jgi:hypothetical protein
MIVKIRDKYYDSEETPIMLVLTDNDKQNITNMLPECDRYCSYPDGMDSNEIPNWMGI